MGLVGRSQQYLLMTLLCMETGSRNISNGDCLYNWKCLYYIDTLWNRVTLDPGKFISSGCQIFGVPLASYSK